MKKYLVIVLFIYFTFIKWGTAQSKMDTIVFNTPELKVNNQYFLYDLDSILLQHCYGCDTNNVYLIDIDQKRKYVYQLKVIGTLWKYAKDAKGYFMYNNKYYFVKGTFPENPQPLFTQTDNVYQFFYEEPHYDTNVFWIFADGDCCSILLEYRYQKLFFLEKLW